MKILPKWYRADNTMWFAQTGTTMHMAVFKRFVTNNEGLENVETTVYASIVEGEDKQDGNMVLSIMESVFKHYKIANPGITDIHCKADNGKNYIGLVIVLTASTLIMLIFVTKSPFFTL